MTQRASVELFEAVPLEAKGDDRDVVGVLSRELAEAADREEKVLEGVARLRLERSSLAHLRRRLGLGLGFGLGSGSGSGSGLGLGLGLRLRLGLGLG